MAKMLRQIDDEVLEQPFNAKQFIRLLGYMKPYRSRVALALCAIGALCVAVCRLFFSACAQHSARSFEQLTLRLEEREITLRALVDTGNALKDPITNEPVFVLDWQAAARLLPGVALS